MTRGIRVLHAAGSLGLGGTEKVMQLLACHLDPDRFQAAVHAPVSGPREPGLRHCGLGVFTRCDLFAAIDRFAPHIVHVHRGGWPDPAMLRPVKLARGRDRLPALVETNVFGRHDPTQLGRLIDVHLFVSEFCLMRYRLEHDPDADAPAHQVLYNPVDTDFYAGACPDRGPEGFAAPVLGRLSRADPGKWSPLGYEIIPILAREVPGFRYRVVGATPEVEAWVAARGLASCVEFLPPLSSEAELADFFNSLTALAHACDTGESFGLAIAEAMAAGLPVVTHPSPWPRDNAQVELVEHEVTGLVARGTEAYARACLSLLSDRDKAWTLGRAGREKAGRCYRVQDVARRLEDIYTDLLAGRKAGT